MMRLSFPWLLCLPLLWLGTTVDVGVARAQSAASPTGEDFGVANSEWNGISELLRGFQVRGVEVVLESPNLANLGVDQPLWVINPQEPLPISDLVLWMTAGGTLLLADDFGEGEGLFNELGLMRIETPVTHNQYFRDNPSLPVFQTSEQTSGVAPIVRGEPVVVANHPAALIDRTSGASPTIPFANGTAGLIFEVPVGQGRLIAVSDPSLFINLMMQFPGNRTLANNL
ncbi:MAG: hypothetical protein KC561_10790, partial [Myxococcales bacterium]|nr:hypothetical protein [Myxococcales bacterium]